MYLSAAPLAILVLGTLVVGHTIEDEREEANSARDGSRHCFATGTIRTAVTPLPTTLIWICRTHMLTIAVNLSSKI